ncbi:hypothetical protein [Kribbella sp. NPDC050459]|uniref:hypothetical protein n=1 Tax=Kribbella sp. NPDC050459 TaxID=3155785 RepID=UPI0033CA799F
MTAGIGILCIFAWWGWSAAVVLVAFGTLVAAVVASSVWSGDDVQGAGRKIAKTTGAGAVLGPAIAGLIAAFGSAGLLIALILAVTMPSLTALVRARWFPPARPNDTEPHEALPDETHRGDTRPHEALPDETQPGDTRPHEAQYGGPQPSETQANDAQPGETWPHQAQSGGTQPGEARPHEAQSGEAQSSQTHANDAQPGDAQPNGAQPGETQANEAQPGQAQSGETQANDAQPGDAQPNDAQPGETQPDGVQPGQAEPGETQADDAQRGEVWPVGGRAGDGQAAAAQSGAAQSGAAAELARLDDEALCLEWRRSFFRLEAASTASARLAVVQERQRYLDELHRRSPDGLAAWFASGARASGDPLPYVDETRRRIE